MEYSKIEDFQANTFIHKTFNPSINKSYRLMVFFFVFASMTHLWLKDAWTEDWFIANIIFIGGLLFLIINNALLGWFLSALGTAIPLFFHRDQLTQSALLFIISSSGVLFQILSLTLPKAQDRYEKIHLQTIGYLGLIAYFFAAIHKINEDFLNPKYSCAVYGLNKVESYYGLIVPTDVDPYLAYTVIAVELTIPLLYLIKRHFFARTLAILFHIPLTLTMAPAFVFVMSISHIALLSDSERIRYIEILKSRGIWLSVMALLTTIGSLLLHGQMPEWTMIPREFLLWLAFFSTLLAMRKYHAHHQVKTHPSYLILIAFFINGMTPYLGLQYQHTAAMLSNLRIDEGCWNSLIFPESFRLVDDYVRVDTAYYRRPGRIEEYEKIVLDQLWSPPQILQMRRNWCSDSIRPFYMKGSFQGNAFEIKDVCDPLENWPFKSDGVLGIEIFPNALRFQKNLDKKCPQTCVH